MRNKSDIEPFLKIDLITTPNNDHDSSLNRYKSVRYGSQKDINLNKNASYFGLGDPNDENILLSIESDRDPPDRINKLVTRLTRGRTKNHKFFVFLHGYSVTSKYATQFFKQLDSGFDDSQDARIVSMKFDWDGL